MDFDRARETMWGTPGFVVRRSTITSSGLSFMPSATYVVQTVRNDEEWRIFLEWVTAEGGQRIVLPDKVARALWRHYEGIMRLARKERAHRGAATRRSKKSAQPAE